jgi:transposase
MGQPLAITRTALSASELRAQAAKSSDGAVVRRLLALALVREGHSRTVAATLSGMSRQTLGDWVHRYNVAGIVGLSSRTSPGRPPVLSAAQRAELKALVLAGPDPERHAVVRWRCRDLCAEIAARWSVVVCEQTVGRWLRQLHLTRLQPRPCHPAKDPEAEAAFKKLRHPGERGPAGVGSGPAARDLVPG